MPELSIEKIREEIEIEREWRESELRFFRNRLTYLSKEAHRKIYRKSLIVLLYAHFEGLCKNILMIYAEALNTADLRIEEANTAIAAASLNDIFQALRNPSSKCKIFKKELPDDSKLHRFARDREFIDTFSRLALKPVSIDVDSLVDTESNLKPIVLKKILYRLGLDPTLVEPWQGTIQELLRRRNDVAHGSAKEGVDEITYRVLEQAVYSVIDDLVRVVSEAIDKDLYRRSPIEET